MLSKLLKYDYRWINKTMYIYFIILAVISIFLKVVNSLDQTFFIMILDRIMFSLFISAIITVVINLMMRVWARITTNLYRDESYLTHTLPVEKSKLYDAKIIAMILSTVLSLLVIVLCIAFVYLDKTGITYLKDMYHTVVDLYGSTSVILIIIGTIVLVLLEFLSMLFSGVFGIIVGHRANNHKVVKSIACGLLSYWMLSMICLVMLKVISSIYNIDIIQTEIPTLHVFKTVLLISLLIYLVCDILLYLCGKIIFKKGVNID